VGPQDVRIAIAFCGVCHSDVHTARNEWPGTVYPCVPGHEAVGHVVEVGAKVTKYAVGDTAAVGCMVHSCRACPSCLAGEEQYCERRGVVWTYNSPDPHGTAPVTYGGYSTEMVVDEAFCLRIPAGLDLAAAAPLLCAGVTMYSPLRHWGIGPGSRVGIVGLGGLGHMGIKLAHALGAHTVLFSGSAHKVQDAKNMGADEVVLNSDTAGRDRLGSTFDLMINTVAVSHDLNPFLRMLKRHGTMALVGVPEHAHPPVDAGALIFARRNLSGSLIGGIRQTQEMLEFCAKNDIVSDVEVLPAARVNEAYDRMLRSDVRYRFVLDMKSLAAA
jgi:alcohol dehydrogenase (NADP+)